MEFKELEAMTETHECAHCGGTLVVIHADGEEPWRLVCGQDHSHAGIKKHESVTTAIARGHADKTLGKGSQKSLEQSISRRGTEFTLAAKTDVGSGNAITLEQLAGLVKWAAAIGLNAYLGHVCLYYGEPYVTIDGYYYLLNDRNPELRVGTRPFNKEERELYQITEGSHAWIAEAWLSAAKLPTTGLGIITKEETDAPSKADPKKFRAPVAHDKPQRMAEKRAEWQLLRKLVPLEEITV